MERATRRKAELIALSSQSRRRREQLRQDRERLRVQIDLRRTLLNSADKRAAAAILEAAVGVAGMSVRELWLEYFALGGDASIGHLAKMLTGEAPLHRGDHDRLAVALNERLAQNGWGRPLAYWDGSH